MKILSILLFLSFSFSACSQNTIITQEYSVLDSFTIQEYNSDINELVISLKQHPKFGEFIEKDSFDNLVTKTKSFLTDKTNRGEFLWMCREIAASIGCGHTFVPTLTKKWKIPVERMFPVDARFIGDQLFVIDPFINSDLVPEGAEIIAINGFSPKYLKKEILKHISADAFNPSFKENLINRDFMLYCTYQLGFPKRYVIKYVHGEQSGRALLNPFEVLDSISNPVSGCAEDLCFDLLDAENAALISIRSFNYYNDRLPIFKEFIDQSFATIKSENIENLIIDIRDNGGGDPYAASYLLQHLLANEYTYYQPGSTSHYQDLQKPISLEANRFSGSLYFLINGRCFSTSGHFLSLIEAQELGTIIGQESGATYTCNAATQEISLKNTFINAYVARATFMTTANEFPENRGLVPEYITSYTLEDLIHNRDVELEFVLDLIRNK